MRKLLAASIPAMISLPIFASPMPLMGPNVIYYKAMATSEGITVAAGSPTSVFYISNTNGTASNPATPAVAITKWSEWYIDTASGNFTGSIYYGNYKTQTNVTTPAIDGRQTFIGVEQAFSGIATWTSATHLTYNYLNAIVNGGGASTQTENAASCSNGQTSIIGKVCSNFASVSRSWEGLAFDFDFFNSYYNFSGLLTATDTSGSGSARNTTTIVWNIEAIDPPAAVPLPAAAWLFGSALIGLAATGRRRSATRQR